MPRIAVSVDMMDTGIDVPEIVNLVFFKKIRSKTKFWQMIGRGTRLCPNLCCTDGENGGYADKKYFYIFDYLGNFEFFRTNGEGVDSAPSPSNAESVFGRRVRLIYHFQDAAFADATYQNWRKELIDATVFQINGLNRDRVSVRPYRESIEKYKSAECFDALSETAKNLQKKATIPQIKDKIELIKSVSDKDFLIAADLPALEKIRTELRELIKFLVDNKNKTVFTDLQDVRIEKNGAPLPLPTESADYKERVNSYILNHKNMTAIYKLCHNLPMTEADFAVLERVLTGDLGSKEDYVEAFKDKPLGILVRQIAKVDREAAMNAFAEFINDNALTQQQIVFVGKIVDYIVQNGFIEPAALNAAPFDNPQRLVKLFNLQQQRKLYGVIANVKNNALQAMG